jgi:hypothetical protein
MATKKEIHKLNRMIDKLFIEEKPALTITLEDGRDYIFKGTLALAFATGAKFVLRKVEDDYR